MKKKLIDLKLFCHQKYKGFTILELIVSLGISSVVLIIIVLFIGISGKTVDSTVSRNKLNNSGRYAMTYIEKEIRRSINIYSIEELNLHKKGRPLNFVIEVFPYQEKNRTKYQYIYYYLEDNFLRRYSITSENSIEEGLKNIEIGVNTIAENINSISKSYYNKDEKFVHLNFETKYKNNFKIYESSIYAGVGQ